MIGCQNCICGAGHGRPESIKLVIAHKVSISCNYKDADDNDLGSKKILPDL